MNSLSDIQDHVLQTLVCLKHIGYPNKYDALVKSFELRKAACGTGFIMMEIRIMLEEILRGCNADEVCQLYNETSAGQLTRAQGLKAPTSAFMVEDITAELLRRIAKTACAEARERMGNKFAPWKIRSTDLCADLMNSGKPEYHFG